MEEKKLKALKTRLILGPAMVLAISALVLADFRLDGGKGRLCAVLMGMFGIGASLEYIKMLKKAGRPVAGRWLLLASILLHGSAVLVTPCWKVLDRELYAPVLLTLSLLLPLSARALSKERMAQGLEEAGATLMGFILISWPLYLGQGLCLRALPWMVWLAIVAKGGDTGAYLVGILLGKHKMIPHVSPGKSWEGAFGGLVCSVLLGVSLSSIVRAEDVSLPFEVWILLGIMAGLLAQLSDLVESMVKRLCGTKDSSKLVPVHGGILDLVDSFILSTPPLFLFVIILTGGN